LDAVKNSITIIREVKGVVKDIGENATVTLNKLGKVITTHPMSSGGFRIK